jgi:polysaccharide chain length determinant protein (PEP-CTERM system associated)
MSMIENRELTMEDYLAIVRRRLKVVLIPLLLAPLAGYLISHAFSPKYTSQAILLVEGQKVPEDMVKPAVSQDFIQRLSNMQQQVQAASRLRPMLDRLGVKQEDQGKLIEQIKQNLTVAPVYTDLSIAASKTTKKNSSVGSAFYVNFSSSNPQQAQQICNEIASLLLEVNLQSRVDTVKGTSDFLGRQVDDAKRALDEQDAKLAAFKKQYMGQLPIDQDSNLKMLMSLNSQLDATTQTLNRAQQDRTYTEGLLAQQIAGWKASQSSTNPQTLEQQLTALQAQLMQLQARYTNDHPDVIKTKADIAEVQKKLDEVNKASGKATDTTEKANVTEPPEVRQLRLQIHQYETVIAQATNDQKKLQNAIQLYQSRTAMSPAIEEQYKQLSRDYDNLQAFYRDLLAKKSSSELTTSMENEQQGEQMHVLNPASLPDAPSFPNRLYFAGGGMAAGFALGLSLAIWLELRDKAIRTEKDAAVAMDLPLLVSVPWVIEGGAVDGNGKRSFWKHRDGVSGKLREKIEI